MNRRWGNEANPELRDTIRNREGRKEGRGEQCNRSNGAKTLICGKEKIYRGF